LATGHISGKLFFEGHSSGHTDSNDTGLEFLSRQGAEKKSGHTHTDGIRIIYNMCPNSFCGHMNSKKQVGAKNLITVKFQIK
jgi:hypothetical protein